MTQEAIYELKKYKMWRMEIYFATLNFFSRFKVYPEHVCASQITFDRLELLTGKSFEAIQKTYFGAYKYNLQFTICNNLADNQICLLTTPPTIQTGQISICDQKRSIEQLSLKFD